MAEKSQQIRDAYNVRTGSKRETFKQVNAGARFEGIGPKDKNRITLADIRKWYLEHNIGALNIQSGFNSYVPPQTTTSCKSICSNTNLSNQRGHT